MSLEPATNTDARCDSGPMSAVEPNPGEFNATWLLGMLQVGDSFYPTGSYAHSFGLEGLVHEGVIHDRATLRTYVLRSALPTLQHVELPIAAHAWRALAQPDWAAVADLCVLSSALRTTKEARLASEKIGRQRTELVATLRGSELAQEFLQRAERGGWSHSSAMAAALEARAIGAPLGAVLAGVAYTHLASLVSAAMKILRLGQNAAQSLLTEALTATPMIISAAQQTPLDRIGWFNPWLDIAAARHETADARMFIS